ncbi:hypothetical protein L0B53_17005 [Vibrio sp. SS-MA-C1-2]|uniref:fimbrial protein n=1 Tax=Vibrio sp. SS-MA-C1-2 TaxID=2908646 RepID=UPI001F46068D|nr:hypothetical protein [Vibrio sp. SS-MA-C1-2]UJF18684.1 hypothetical protein L0B53_17005 [Vibrio sp. SS-MA-C1-2]
MKNEDVINRTKQMVAICSILLSSASYGAGNSGVVNFNGMITNTTCDTKIVVDGAEVGFVDLGIVSTTDFNNQVGKPTVSDVKFAVAAVDPTSCLANTASINLVGQGVSGFDDVLSSDDIATTHVGVQVLFDDDTQVLNKGLVPADTNFDFESQAIQMKANFFATEVQTFAGSVKSNATYQIVYL